MATRTENFMQWCGFFGVNGTIDNTHIIISKPITPFPKDYYYHKNNGYSIQAQVTVDSNKKLLDVCVGFLSSVNNVRVMHRSTLYCHVQYHNLFDPIKGVEGISPYFLGDKGYLLINWIMTLFKKDGHHLILELLYNKKHKKGRFVVENVGILKKNI